MFLDALEYDSHQENPAEYPNSIPAAAPGLVRYLPVPKQGFRWILKSIKKKKKGKIRKSKPHHDPQGEWPGKTLEKEEERWDKGGGATGRADGIGNTAWKRHRAPVFVFQGIFHGILWLEGSSSCPTFSIQVTMEKPSGPWKKPLGLWMWPSGPWKWPWDHWDGLQVIPLRIPNPADIPAPMSRGVLQACPGILDPSSWNSLFPFFLTLFCHSREAGRE